MRKYQQLFILALGIVSFICFLIYKHEYDRLRYVVENLEIFGNPPGAASPIPSILDSLDENVLARQHHQDPLLDHPLGIVDNNPESDKLQAQNIQNNKINDNVIQSPVASQEKELSAKKS